MKYSSIGDMRVSQICFGTWGIGGLVNGVHSYGPKDERVSRRALEVAYEQGINFYDTASAYGFGLSERLLGEVFCSVPRSSIYLATKGGYLNYFPSDGKNQRFDAESISRSFLQSLVRLKTNYVDIYQLHSPSFEDLVNNDNLFAFLEKAKEAGLIRKVGFAAKTPADAAKALYFKFFKFDTVQCNFNMTDMRAIDDGVFVACHNAKAFALLRSPLLHGYLTGNIKEPVTFQASDHRIRFTEETHKRWLSALDRFSEHLHSLDLTMAQNAIRCALSISDVTAAAVVGMNTPEQVYENVIAADAPRFTSGEMQDMIRRYKAFFKNHPVEMRKDI